MTEVSGENNLCRQTFYAFPFISKAAQSDAARHKANDLFASAANGHTLFTRLFCAEQPVARVSQAGNYIAVVVKIFVYARKINVYVVMLLPNSLYAFGRGDKTYELYVPAAMALYRVYGRNGEATVASIGSTIIMSRSEISLGSLQ